MRADRSTAVARISHAAALVPDLDPAARLLARLLGWGPWSVYELKPPRLRDRVYRGWRGTYSMLGAETHVGDCDFALNQALTGPSIYGEFVERRGFGLHHLACMESGTAAGESLRERLADRGVAMSGSIDGEIEFFYFDTEPDLGVFIETGSGHAISLAPNRVIESDENAPGPARFEGVSVVVEDLDQAIEAYERLLGWGSWQLEERANLIEDAVFAGDRAEVSGRVASTNAGPVRLELVEPGSAPSPERDALNTSGPGLHHISCALPAEERERIAEVVRLLGLEILMRSSEQGLGVLYIGGLVPLRLTFA